VQSERHTSALRLPAALPPGDSGERRRRGAFYTPPGLAEALVGWAVRRTTHSVFDPGYGGGELLACSVERLRALRRREPARCVYGVEVEVQAARAGRERLGGLGVPEGHLLTRDFFGTAPGDLGTRGFDAIVGNPPYVRHHLLSAEDKARARACANRSGVALGERADAWAYVVAHLLRFVAPGGRMGVLLPTSVLHADYALPVLEALGADGRRSRLIRIKQHQFADVVERTVVLLLERTDGPGEVAYDEVADLDALHRHLRRQSRWSAGSPLERGERRYSADARRETRMRWFLHRSVADLWEAVIAMPEVETLADVATIRIGAVTGANRFFVRSQTDIAPLLGPGVRAVPVVSRGGWPEALRWTADDDAGRADSPSRLLVVEAGAELNEALRDAVDTAVEDGLDQSSHCRKRDPWYALSDYAVPDIFLPYMAAEAPRLVVNLADATCTNSIHRAWRRAGAPAAAELAVASWTSVCRLSAELIGRSYGAGVLKLEIGEANELRLPLIPGGGEHLSAVSHALEQGGREAARRKADQLILRDGLGLTTRDVRRLRDAAHALQRRRGH
jgi:adenine-specific DNA-methyltransferase